MVDQLPKDSVFCVSGNGPAQLPAGINGLLLGAQIVRVGLEDNLYYRQGELATNVQLTERIVRIIREMDYEPASPRRLPNIGSSAPGRTDLAELLCLIVTLVDVCSRTGARRSGRSRSLRSGSRLSGN